MTCMRNDKPTTLEVADGQAGSEALNMMFLKVTLVVVVFILTNMVKTLTIIH